MAAEVKFISRKGCCFFVLLRSVFMVYIFSSAADVIVLP